MAEFDVEREVTLGIGERTGSRVRMMFRVVAPGKIACNVGFYRYNLVSFRRNGSKMGELNDN